jgi:integrase
MGLLTNSHGVYILRKKVPTRLERAVAQLRGEGKPKQTFLQQSLRTKDVKEAKRRAVPVLLEFDRILAEAESLVAERPLRQSLTDTEIRAIADYFYALELTSDEDDRRDGTGSEEFYASVARQLSEAGIQFTTPFNPGAAVEFGLTDRELSEKQETVSMVLPAMQAALARGDISRIRYEMDALLDAFGINLDPQSPSYRKLGLSLLAAFVQALEGIHRRNRGEVVETPQLIKPGPQVHTTVGGASLSAALAGWQKDRRPAAKTLAEYLRAVKLFTELHGDIPVASIKRSHALSFREALQDTPRRASGKLWKATLPELAEWGRANPNAPKLLEGTINKLIGGVQTVSLWGYSHGLIPDEAHWSDPFARMRLEEGDTSRDTFTTEELHVLFWSPVFTEGERPAGLGAATYWLPLLGLLTGARRGELAGLTASDVQAAGPNGEAALRFEKDLKRGKSLKTKQSARIVPVHPELTRIGFEQYVDEVRRNSGDEAWLFPEIAPQSKYGVTDWSKWFSSYLRAVGISDPKKVFHTFRGGFVDALRMAGVDDELKRALVGHARKGSAHDAYGAKAMLRRFGWQRLSQAVASVTYPGLNLDHLASNATATQRKHRGRRRTLGGRSVLSAK